MHVYITKKQSFLPKNGLEGSLQLSKLRLYVFDFAYALSFIWNLSPFFPPRLHLSCLAHTLLSRIIDSEIKTNPFPLSFLSFPCPSLSLTHFVVSIVQSQGPRVLLLDTQAHFNLLKMCILCCICWPCLKWPLVLLPLFPFHSSNPDSLKASSPLYLHSPPLIICLYLH